MGFRSDVPEILSLLDVQVIPSLMEGFPLCLAEAMASGNAIVASEVGGMKDIGQDMHTVFFVPPRDSAALAKAVTTVLQNTELANSLSSAAKGDSTQFGIEKSAAHLGAIYEELVLQ